jgi:competence protein ComEC
VRIIFINVGHGDAILVDYGDTEILIDAGTYTTPSSAKELLCQAHRYVDDGRIELAVVTHPDKDHYGGFIALLGPREPAVSAETICVAKWRLFFPTLTDTSVSERPTFRSGFEALSRTPNTSDAPPDYLEVPELVFEGNGLRLFAIPTARGGTDSDDRAPVLIIEYAGAAVVLSGDSGLLRGASTNSANEARASVEAELQRGRFQAIALLAPHHGHGEFADFFSQMVPSPDILIISDECVPSLGAPMVPCSAVYSTAKNGTIVLTTDGTRLDVLVQRAGVTQVVFFDVGQGDAILIDSGSQEMLIDGGADGSWVSQLDEYVQGPLEVVVVTHPHTDHIGGLDEVLRAFDVLTVVTNGARSESSAYANFASSVSAEGLVPTIVRRGDTIAAGQLCMNVLGPAQLTGDANGDSLVLSLQVGATSFLLTGDIDTAAEAELLRSQCLGPVDVLKVAHHGSAYGTSSAFLAATTPTWAIYSAGLRNGYGHPAPATLARLREHGAEILGTDCRGAIIFVVDETTGMQVPVCENAPCAR